MLEDHKQPDYSQDVYPKVVLTHAYKYIKINDLKTINTLVTIYKLFVDVENCRYIAD